MVQDSNKSIPVGTLEELEQKGCLSVTAQGHDIVVFYHEGQVHALDNRCPHMGFPLSRGSTKDGILTCDWHHARFDIKSGGCFDLWADEVPIFAVNVIDGTIFVNTERGNKRTKDEHRAYYLRRLNDAMEQNIALIIAKSVLTLDSGGVSSSDLFGKGLEYGTRYRQEGWGPGLTILTCMMNLAPYSRGEDRPRALYHGLSAAAGDCSGQPPRFAVSPLPDVKSSADVVTLKRWFRHFIEVRDTDGAERCLVTAIRAGTKPHILADMLFSAATDHHYLDSGHVLDFTNKAFEALDIVGWDLAEQVLTSLVTLYAQATRMEERSSWRHPVDIVALLTDCFDKLPAVLEEKGKQSRTTWKASKATIDVLLGDNPNAIVNVLIESLQDGAKEEELAAIVAYTAALRIVQFPITNEYSDWDTTLHTFTFANAVQQAIRRLPSSKELLRAIFDVAMSNYLNRFLNVPCVALPSEKEEPINNKDSENNRGNIMDRFLDTLDKRHQVNEAAKMVATCISTQQGEKEFSEILVHALLREDRSFHTIQMLEAAFRQKTELQRLQVLEGIKPISHILIAAARYLAAHTPSARAQGQTFEIAWRLHQGGKLYEKIG
ncbi:MAG TPA: Rieske (2Fe-2S) protein [Nitrososphaeraceae archaeon]|nr:Rieske (2Fe-2S) protein [Nitrososphaeraceae archaeon]